MCGIFGIVTKDSQVLGPTLIEAGHKLSYRGYDTVGAATIPQQGEIDLRKDAGRVEDVAAKYNFAEMRGDRAILQLRWATFGAPSQVNSQPHLDSDGDQIWSITDNGFAKTTDLNAYPTQGRYGQGVINMRLPAESSEVVAMVVGGAKSWIYVTTVAGAARRIQLGKTRTGSRSIKPRPLMKIGQRNRVSGAVTLLKRYALEEGE